MLQRSRTKVKVSSKGSEIIRLGQSLPGHTSFQEAGVADGEQVAYSLEDGNSFEIGYGTFNSGDLTLRRDLIIMSKAHGSMPGTSALYLSGNATLSLTTFEDSAASSYSVLDFGAKGDGETPDAEAIQKCLDMASADGVRTVRMPNPKGFYVIDRTVVIPDNMIIVGDNKYRTGFSRCVSANDKTMFVIENGVAQAGLCGLTIDGQWCAMAIQTGGREILFRDLIAQNCPDDAIWIGETGMGVIINGCHITNAGNSLIRMRGCGLAIGDNSRLEHSQGTGLLCETASDISITASSISRISGAAIVFDGGNVDEAALEAVVCANRFVDINTGNNAKGVITARGSNISIMAIHNNTLRRSPGASCATEYFVYFDKITPLATTISDNAYPPRLITVAESNA